MMRMFDTGIINGDKISYLNMASKRPFVDTDKVSHEVLYSLIVT